MQSLRDAQSFAAAEEAWLDGIEALEKVWNRAAAEYRLNEKFAGWNGTYVALRNSDPLLQYVHQARNADSHSIQDSVAMKPGGIGFGPTDSKHGMYIKNMVIRNEGGRTNVHIESPDPVRVSVRAPRLKLVSISNRGAKFDPPEQHKGTDVDGENPAEVLRLAIKHYEEYLQELESELGT